MSTELNFSDEPLNLQNDFDNWEPAPEFAPPPPAGTYQMYLSKIHDEGNNAPRETETKQGKRLFTVLDFRILGGEYDERAVNFQRISNIEYARKGETRKTSFMLDLVKSGGAAQAPRSNKEFYEILKGMAERGPAATFKAQIDWEGNCGTCREQSMMLTTGEQTKEDAKRVATKETWDAARVASVKAKNARAFPLNANGTRKDSFICAECGSEVRAQVVVKRFTP